MNTEIIDFDIFGHDLTAQVDFSVHDKQVFEIEKLTILGDGSFDDISLDHVIHVFEERIINELLELRDGKKHRNFN